MIDMPWSANKISDSARSRSSTLLLLAVVRCSLFSCANHAECLSSGNVVRRETKIEEVSQQKENEQGTRQPSKSRRIERDGEIKQSGSEDA